MGVSSNRTVYTSQSLNLLLSSSLRSIFSSKKFLKVKFCGQNMENSLLKCQRSSSKSQNEKPLISHSIGSFQVLSPNRIHAFLLIFLLITSNLNFESLISRTLDLISVFSLFTFGFSTQFLLVYFFTNLDPNPMFFYCVDSSLSCLSKNIKISNFSPQFIIRFDQI